MARHVVLDDGFRRSQNLCLWNTQSAILWGEALGGCAVTRVHAGSSAQNSYYLSVFYLQGCSCYLAPVFVLQLE